MNRWFAIAVLALAVAGVAFGGGLLLAPWGAPGPASVPVPQPGAAPADPNGSPRTRADQYMIFGPGALWSFGVLMMFAVWFASVGYGLWELRARYGSFGTAWRACRRPASWDAGGICWALLLALLFFAPSLLGPLATAEEPVHTHIPVLGYGWKLSVMLGCAFLASLTWLILLRRADRRAEAPDLTLAGAADLLRDARVPLAGLGLMVSLVALGTAAMRTGLNQFHGREVLRLEAVVAYGLYYTFALAAVYAPVHLRIGAAARRAADAALPAEPEPTTGLPPEAVQKQREDALRRIGVGGWDDTFRSAVVVASPLLTTALALVLPTK